MAASYRARPNCILGRSNGKIKRGASFSALFRNLEQNPLLHLDRYRVKVQDVYFLLKLLHLLVGLLLLVPQQFLQILQVYGWLHLAA